MLTTENTIVINRPIADVFAFVADGETAPRWRPAVVSVKLKSGSKDSVGAVYMQRVKGGPMGNVPADYEVTKYEPNRRLEFRAIAGPVRPEGSISSMTRADRRRSRSACPASLQAWRNSWAA